MTIQIPIWERAQGKWRSILPTFGIDEKFLTGRHGPCPICNRGTDRFRFDDKDGRGTYICNSCGAGSGVDLIMKVTGFMFKEVAFKIENIIGKELPEEGAKPQRDEKKCRNAMNQLWQASTPILSGNHVDQYLRARGIDLAEYPNCLRSAVNVPYFDDGGKEFHPAMLAKLTAPDGSPATIHRTYLTSDGRKADVRAPRRLMPGQVEPGSAIRLAEHGETLGVAEGIETALSAAILFKVPVWAAVSAGMLMKFIPPENVKTIIVFGDNDRTHRGQEVAHGLARRLISEGKSSDVFIPKIEGDDWNDVLMAERGLQSNPDRRHAA